MRELADPRNILVALVALVAAWSMAAPAHAQPGEPCVVADDGSGTVQLPPPGCDYLSPADVHMIIDGLPAGTEIMLAPIHTRFICPAPGGECGDGNPRDGDTGKLPVDPGLRAHGNRDAR